MVVYQNKGRDFQYYSDWVFMISKALAFYGVWIAGMDTFYNKYNNCKLVPATNGIYVVVSAVLVL